MQLRLSAAALFRLSRGIAAERHGRVERRRLSRFINRSEIMRPQRIRVRDLSATRYSAGYSRGDDDDDGWIVSFVRG